MSELICSASWRLPKIPAEETERVIHCSDSSEIVILVYNRCFECRAFFRRGGRGAGWGSGSQLDTVTHNGSSKPTI